MLQYREKYNYICVINLEQNGENNRSKRDAFIKVTRETRATAKLSAYGQWTDFNTYKFENVTADNLLDFTDDAVRQQLGIDFDKLTKVIEDKADMYQFTNELASWARKNGYNGIIAPGARGAKNYENIILFEQAYTDQIFKNITPKPIKK